jgi:DNA-binding response OmpR family regulator
MTHRVLIIDQDVGAAESLQHNLELDGHAVRREADAQWGIIEARTFGPDLVITTLEMAQEGGGRLLPQLRQDHEQLPVLVLGSRAEEGKNLPVFRFGVDDFLLRSATVGQLCRRIETLLRRNGSTVDDSRPSTYPAIVFGEVEVHPAARLVRRNGKPVTLRLKEFDLLIALVNREGAVVTRLDLLRGVWGYRAPVATRTVDTHIGELRAKLETDPTNPQHILTVRKVGYRFQR